MRLPDGWVELERGDLVLTVADGAPSGEGDPGDLDVSVQFTIEPAATADDWRRFVAEQGGEVESDGTVDLDGIPATMLQFAFVTNGTPTRERVIVVPSRQLVTAPRWPSSAWARRRCPVAARTSPTSRRSAAPSRSTRPAIWCWSRSRRCRPTPGIASQQVIAREQHRNGNSRHIDVASNPEFLKEGSAVQDTLHPDRIVYGTSSERARDALREVYRVVAEEDGARSWRPTSPRPS
jgi:hypothetical protein